MNTEWKKFSTSKRYSVFSIALGNAYFLQVFVSITISLKYITAIWCLTLHVPAGDAICCLRPWKVLLWAIGRQRQGVGDRWQGSKTANFCSLFVWASSCPKHMEILCTFEDCELLTCFSGETVNHLCTRNTLRLFCCDFLFLGFPLS